MVENKPLDSVSWGIIGVGDVCEVKSAPAMQLIPHSRIAAVMRRDAAKAQAYAERHKVPHWYDNAEKLIADKNVNAIYVATPPHVHCEYVLQAAASKKPVYVEKPVANSYADCLTVVTACKAASVPLFSAYYRRCLPHFLKVKSLIEEGAIGQVRHVEVRMCKPSDPPLVANSEVAWRVDPNIGVGGYFADLASHQLDALDFLLGPITQAKGFSANQAGLYETPDVVCATWLFESGVTGVGSWCFTASDDSDRDETTIVGSKGEISYASFGEAEVQLTRLGSVEQFTFDLPSHIQYPLIEQIVAELRGKGQCVSTGESGARASQVIEWILTE